MDTRKLLKLLVPGTGTHSNSEASLSSEFCQTQNAAPHSDQILLDQETCDDLFRTLAEWNEYLENHVPYFQEPQEPQP